jgi:glyoxylase-like metal-dependent hydrolase (beta-lactamase superfamily II)
LRWGGYAARVIHTPGHTPGSIALYADAVGTKAKDAAPVHGEGWVIVPAADSKKLAAPDSPLLIAGDTLFQGSIGRTDLWGGSMKDILRSIREKLLVLPNETRVIAGHGDETTIGAEREENPFLR